MRVVRNGVVLREGTRAPKREEIASKDLGFGEEFDTYDGWAAQRYHVNAGEKSRHTFNGIPVFKFDQVSKDEDVFRGIKRKKKKKVISDNNLSPLSQYIEQLMLELKS